LFVTLTRKIRTPLTAEQAGRYLDQIAAWPVIVLDYRAMRHAIELSDGAKLSFWDALIVLGCVTVGGPAALYGRFTGRADRSGGRECESVWRWEVAPVSVLI
jgi:predicted nucleic acid-binding protein